MVMIRTSGRVNDVTVGGGCGYTLAFLTKSNVGRFLACFVAQFKQRAQESE